MIQFPDLIRRNAFQCPDRKAVHFEGRDFSWSEFNARCLGMARSLADLGVAPGDRVAYLGLNSHWLVECYFVPSYIGAISVPINHRLSEDEMVDLIADCTPQVLIVDRHFSDRAAALMARCPSLTHLIHADWDGPGDELPADTLSYDTLVAEAGAVPPDALRDRASRSDETMILFYTSGTTGQPKGVMLSHSNLLINGVGAGPLYGFCAEDVVLLSGPLFHLGTGSRAFNVVLYGAAMAIQPRFQVEEMMQLIEDQRVTTLTLVPTMVQMVLDHPDFDKFDFSSMRCLTYGAAPMPVALIERAIAAVPGLTFCQAYGMTETSPVLSMLPRPVHVPGNPLIDKLASVGKPMDYCDLRVVDEKDKTLPAGQPGEIVVRGPQVMNGYWQRPEDTAHAMRGGFYHTGDAGYLDEDGYLHLVGRTKEMIISGGENIYPIETENCLLNHPAIAQCAVVGLPDPFWGEAVHAVVTAHDGSETSEEALIAFCRARIAHYKAPRGVTFWSGPLPLSATNKIDKAMLKRTLTEEMKL